MSVKLDTPKQKSEQTERGDSVSNIY